MKFHGEYQITVTLMTAANLIAFTVSGANIKYFVVSVVSFVILLFGFEKFVSMKAGGPGQSRKEQRMLEEEVFVLPLNDAKNRVEALLSDPSKFIVQPADLATTPPLSQLGVTAPGLLSFFSKYRSARATRADFFVSWEHCGLSSLRPGYIRIGVDIAHTELVVRPDKETVYQIDGGEPRDSELTMFPSIFHLIVFIDRLVFPSHI